MIRTALALIAFFACTAAGAVRAESYRLRLAVLADLVSDIALAETRLRYARDSVGAIVEELAKNGRLKKLWQEIAALLSNGSSFREAWEKASANAALGHAERDAMSSFAAGFGRDDIETELDRLALASAALGAALEEKRRAYPNKAKLAGALGTVLGAALALVIV